MTVCHHSKDLLSLCFDSRY